MPIPKYDLPEYKPDETELKAGIIVRKLSKMGYSVNWNVQDIPKI